MAKKTTTSAPTNAGATSATTEAPPHSELTGASSTAQDGAGANSTDTPESEAASTQTVGTGNSAGPAIRLADDAVSAEVITKLLGGEVVGFLSDADGNLRVATDIDVQSGRAEVFVLPEGFENWEDLAAMAAAGKDIVRSLERSYGPDNILKDLSPDTAPLDAVEWMLSSIDVLSGTVDTMSAKLTDLKLKINVPADAKAAGKRGFMLLGNVRLNNKRRAIGDVVWLTADEHAELRPSKAVHEDWESGIKV